MRCPKCGYITFDHLETCTKCSKNIAAVSQKLSGTVDKAETPSFLHFESDEPETNNDVSVGLLPKDDDIDLEMSADRDDDFDLDMSADRAEGVDDELLLAEKDTLKSDETQADEDLDLESDEGVEALGLESNGNDESDLAFSEEESIGLDLDVEDTDAAYDEDGTQVDFSELDISDLAPPEAEEHDLSPEELTIEGVEDVSVATVVDEAQASMEKPGTGLEDLQMEGLDLEMPSLPPAGSVIEKKLMTTAKTGTALDEFDIDLGELISDLEK